MDEAKLPTDEASPIGPYIFFYFYFFNVFCLSAAGLIPSKSALKIAFSENLCWFTEVSLSERKCTFYFNFGIFKLQFFYFYFFIFFIQWWNRAAKTYQRANNVGVKKNPIWGKIFAKFYAALSGKWVMAQFCTFWLHFFATFYNFIFLFGIFLHYFGLLGFLRSFVEN